MKDSQQKKIKKENKERSQLHLYYLVLVTLGIVCLFALNYDLNKKISLLKLGQQIDFRAAPYPVFSGDLEISAAGAAVLDSDSHILVFSKNPTRFFSPASTTKILTALVALDNFRPDDVMTVYSDDIEGSTIGLKKGDRITLENLIYAMMLPSSNEAAIAIAENYPGGKAAFVAEMNKKAKYLGLMSTHLEDPVGLMDEANITTPQDLAILGNIAMENKYLAEIVKTKAKTIKTLDGQEFNISNLNILLNREGVEGVKTGFTQTSGEVLVTSKKREGKRVIVVVMQSEDRFGDTAKILEKLSSSLNYLTIQP